jgi:mono/diheme cytochrome c family protein
MYSHLVRALALVSLTTWVTTCSATQMHPALHAVRASAGDLEIAGDLAGVPAGSTRYLRYEDLLALPQESYLIDKGDAFSRPVTVSGVPLATLGRMLSTDKKTLFVAICYDEYRSHYPFDYTQAHRPILVLKINGLTHDDWSQVSQSGQLGPYLIAHPHFTPSFRILSHTDESQNPYGVTRLEIRDEESVLGPLRPPGRYAADSPEFMGYRIAQQNCLRCHNRGPNGGQKARRSWLQLSAWAFSNPESFKRYVHDPASVIACARMPAEKTYDEPTLDTLVAYFRTFIGSPQPASQFAK